MNADGQIVSFYSYKGGVGRSMALANIAVLLAQQEKRVLVIDLDLEAPGLHRYFLERPRADWSALDGGAGAIEFFTELRTRLHRPQPAGSAIDEQESLRRIIGEMLDDRRYLYSVRVKNPNLPASKTASLRFMPAGRFDEGYPERVHAFDWQAFYERFEDVFPVLGDELRSRYDYVLIDSRTGITDIGSVCTVLLPDKLVLAFSANQQSLHGAVEIARQAARQKRAFTPEQPLLLFPLPGRLENAEKELQRTWLEQARHRFEQVFQEAYERADINLTAYFNLVRIQHNSFYAYGETIAAEQEPYGATGSMAAAFHLFLTCLGSKSVEELIAISTTEAGAAVTKTAALHVGLRDAIISGRPAQRGLLLDYLTLFDKSVEEFDAVPGPDEHLDDLIYRNIGLLTPYRNEFIDLLDVLCKYAADDEIFREPLIQFLQGILRLQGRYKSSRALNYWQDSWSDHFRFFLHELFLYVIAVLLRWRKFSLAASLLENEYYREIDGSSSFHPYTVFRRYARSLNEERNRRLYDGRRLSVTADLIKERARVPGYPFEDLKQADFVLFFNAILHEIVEGWYPETLVYEEHRPFKLFSMAESAKYFTDLMTLFRVQSLPDLKARYEAGKTRHGISDSFDLRGHALVRIPLLANLEKLATR